MGIFDGAITKYKQQQKASSVNLRDPLGMDAYLRKASTAQPQKTVTGEMERGATISKAPTRTESPVRQLADKLGPVGQSFGEHVLAPVERVTQVLFPSFQDQLRSAVQEDPNRSMEQITERANELDAGALRVSSNPNAPAVDPFGLVGNLRSVTGRLLKQLTSASEPQAVREVLQNVAPGLREQQLKEFADRIAKTTDENEVATLLEEAANVRVPNTSRQPTGQAKLTNIADDDLGEIIDFIDDVRAGKEPTVTNAIAARRLAERYGINPDQSDARLANRIQDAVDAEPDVLSRVANRINNTLDETPESLSPVTLKTINKVRDTAKSTTVSKQFLLDFANAPDIKQAERDLIRSIVDEYETDKVNVADFINKAEARLLPLEAVDTGGTGAKGISFVEDDGVTRENLLKYENITLPSEIRGNVADYDEVVYNSPIKTSAGDVHNFESDNYFAHTRIEDMADNSTRRVIEVQSDLFQKGRLEGEFTNDTLALREMGVEGEYAELLSKSMSKKQTLTVAEDARLSEIETAMRNFKQEGYTELQPYRNTWHERIIREEVKRAAQDGKTKLQFPTGETAMKIEGLGQAENVWFYADDVGGMTRGSLNPSSELKVGEAIKQGRFGDDWIITEVLDDGKFKALPKQQYQNFIEEELGFNLIETTGKGMASARRIAESKNLTAKFDSMIEQFDISGKVDTENPIYKFYEKDVQKYLTKNYGAKEITDEKGVTWMQVNIDRTFADRPVEAFSGAIAGVEEDENGDIQVDPTKAFLGIAAAGLLGKGFIRRPKRQNGTQDAQDVASSRPDQRTRPEQTQIPKAGQTEYPMSSEGFSRSLGEAYVKAGEGAKALSPTDLNPKNIGAYSKFREAIGSAWAQTVRFVQDDMKYVRDLVNDPNVKVTDDSDPYLAEILFHGRIGSRLEEARDLVMQVDRNIIDASKANGVPDSDMSLLVNKYLHARHAPERNAKLGDGAAGLTNADAAAVLSDIDALPYASEVKRIADQIQELNTQTLDVLREAQVIDQKTFDTLRQTYKNHVPLQRVLTEDEDFVDAITSKGFDVRSSGIKRAKGSDRQVADILANVVTNFEQAVVRAEKNRVDLSTLQFVRDNPQLGLFKEVKPKVIGKTLDGKPISERITDPSVLSLRENGQPVHIKIADDNLAMALKGISRQQVPPMLRFVQAFTRFYSGLQTRFNPEFAFPNKIRDIQEALVYAGSRSELGFTGGIRATLDQRAYKDVLDHIRGVDTPGARLYKQMIEDGGTTGGMSLSTRSAIELDIAKIRKLNRSAPRQAADAIIRTIDDFNTVVEDSTRLSLYKQAIDRGVSRKRAAEIAKESTVNFNKMGTGGPLINSLYMFSNASIQGTTKMLRNMTNPKVAAAVTASVGSAVYATGEWNDRIDPEWRDKVTKYDRQNALIVLLPSDDDTFNYAAIPVGWGIKPIKVAMEEAYDAATGHGEGWLSAFNSIGAATLNAYNPLGGTDTFSSITPTIIDIPSEIARNKAWHGGKIKPDWDQNAPESIRYFSSLTDTTTGKSAVVLSQGLSGVGIEVSPADIIYAYQGYIGGAGRTATDVVNTITSVGQGKMPDFKDIPVASRFVRMRDRDEIGAASDEFEKIKDRLQEQSRERFYLNQDAENAYNQLKTLPPEEATSRFDAIKRSDPDMAKKIVEIKQENDLGLTYSQRLIKQLGVSNGERAEYLVEKFNALETKEEKQQLWQEYVEKKIITKDVAKQVIDLLK